MWRHSVPYSPRYQKIEAVFPVTEDLFPVFSLSLLFFFLTIYFSLHAHNRTGPSLGPSFPDHCDVPEIQNGGLQRGSFCVGCQPVCHGDPDGSKFRPQPVCREKAK